MAPFGSRQQPERQPPCLRGRTLTGIGGDQVAPPSVDLRTAGTDPPLGLVGPGPVAPFRGHGVHAPRGLFGLDAALEEGRDAQVDEQGPVRELADPAVPVAERLAPRKHDGGLAPRHAPVPRADEERLAAVMVVGEPLLVEDADQIAVREGAGRDLVHAVLGVTEDGVVFGRADYRHRCSPPAPSRRSDSGGFPPVSRRRAGYARRLLSTLSPGFGFGFGFGFGRPDPAAPGGWPALGGASRPGPRATPSLDLVTASRFPSRYPR